MASAQVKMIRQIIDDGLKIIAQSGHNDLKPHLIYCSTNESPVFHRNFQIFRKVFSDIFLNIMKKYDLQLSLLTILKMERKYLITKETQKQAYSDNSTIYYKSELDWIFYEGSINDDGESFFTRLQDNDLIEMESVESFFLPKLTDAELKLVKQKDKKHFESYSDPNPDINPEEMKKSDSKDKYVHCECKRNTFVFTLDSKSTVKRVQCEIQ